MTNNLVLYVTKGLPGSGKSFWAKQQQTKDSSLVLTSKDDLRWMLHSSKWSKSNEKQVLEIQNSIIINSLSIHKRSVIVHDTNFAQFHVERFTTLAKLYDAELVYKDFTDVPLSVCISQDAQRAQSVGRAVIMKMYNQYLKKQQEFIPRTSTPGLPTAVHVDMDGTLALLGDRNPYDNTGLCVNDEINVSLLNILRHLKADGHAIIICSGREGLSAVVEATQEWLERNQVPYDELHIREPGNHEPDDTLKERFINEVSTRYNYICGFDDRPKVVRKLRSMGIYIYDCNQPGIEF